TIADERGRENVSQFDIPWWTRPDSDLSITADKAKYRPGDVAKLTIASKSLPAVAVVSFALNGVIALKRVGVTVKGVTDELPIEPSYIENIKVVVDLVTRRNRQSGSAKAPITQQPLPTMEHGEIDLSVDVEYARL